MTIKTLINYLNNFNQDDEIAIQIYEMISNKFIDSTFDVAISEKNVSVPTLVIDVEAEKFNQQF